MVDLGRRLRPGMPAVFGVFTLAGLTGIGTYGWAPLIPALAAVAGYGVIWTRNPSNQRHPEYLYAAGLLFAELMMTLAIVLAHGPRGSYFSLMVMPLLLVAVLFPRRVTFAGMGIVVVLQLVVEFGVDRPEITANPELVFGMMLVCVSLATTAMVVRNLDEDSRRSAFVDTLTGALNRAALTPRLAELTHQTMTTGEPVGVIVGDIDHFKVVNDTHGHEVGDRVLRDVARRISDCVSAFEPVYRLGGEEFVVLLPGLNTEAAHAVARQIWQSIRGTPFDGVRVTMSFGVCASPFGEQFDFDAVFASADHELFRAKQGGRDQVRTVLDTPSRSANSSGTETARLRRSDPPTQGPAPVAPSDSDALNAPPPTSGRSVTQELDREHIIDLSGRLTPLFRLIGAGAFALIAGSIPLFGWQDLVGPTVGGLIFLLVSRNVRRFARPGLALGIGWALFQTSIAVGFASSHGGVPLFAIPLLTLMVPGRCGVLRARAAAAGAAYTALLMTLVAFDLHAGQVLHNPSALLFPLALLLEAAYVGSVVGMSAVGHRGAGIVDELTGMLNRNALKARLLALDAQSASVPPRLALVLADLDHFKEINDREGHSAGDEALREAAQLIRKHLRTFESVYRVGGEEFLILLRDADNESAVEVARRLCEAIRSAPCGGQHLTISAGVAVSAPGERFVYTDLFRLADSALYEAKNAGRDRVVVAHAGSAQTEERERRPLAAHAD